VSLSTFAVPSMLSPRRALVRIPSDRITLLSTNYLRTGFLNNCWSRISILLAEKYGILKEAQSVKTFSDVTLKHYSGDDH
jgi:hypothetical protein